MSDPVYAILLLLAFLAVLAVVRFFKTLDPELWLAAATPVLAGVVSGLFLRFLPAAHPAAIGIVLTIAALYVRLTGEESEPIDGMLLGACSGAAATAVLMTRGEHECRIIAECLAAGAITGYGVTFASLHVTDKLRQLVIDVVTAVIAIAAAFVPRFFPDERLTATVVAAIIPLITVIAAFKQWPDVRAELSHEASLGFIADADVRRTANPLLRLGGGGWADRKAHREFVRLANKIALRKRQQRNRPEEIARLYQLEIIKIRMQIQEMSRIDRAVLADQQMPSDTIAHGQ
ncbi:MAG: hypothetical protein DMF57_00045 [Acidobacteria bacterium]|nr:MAG: hypothetical protein DMF57_00045 [Acidobacteriota bacterium]